jgi:hypothetical protein
MILLIIIGIVVLAVGKLKVTRTFVLVGKKARLYGLTLVITAIPFTMLVGGAIAAVTPESVLAHPLWRRLLNFGLLTGYLLVLALPFRERAKSANDKSPDTKA